MKCSTTDCEAEHARHHIVAYLALPFCDRCSRQRLAKAGNPPADPPRFPGQYPGAGHDSDDR